MSRLPIIQRLSTEDFKDQSNWIDKLLYPLNVFTTSLVSALGNNLTVNENMMGQITTITVATSSSVTSGVGGLPSYVALQNAVSFKWNRKLAPVFLSVGNVQEVSGSHTVIPYGVSLDWSYTNGQVTISSVSGLAVSKNYRVTILGLSG